MTATRPWPRDSMTDEHPHPLTKDDVFEILSSSRRRFTLYVLCREGGRLDLDALARRLAAHEEELPLEEVDDDLAKRMYISLYQTHLPKLASAGLIDYDREERTVVLTDRIEEFVGFLRTEPPATPAWPRWYGALAVLALVLVVATLAMPGISTPLVGLLLVDLLAVFGVALAQWRSEARNAVDVETQLESIV